MTAGKAGTPLEMWGGVECTVNRVRDNFHTQLDRSGHTGRDDDLERFASLGIRALRYPVLWESTAPDGIERADWSFADRRLPTLQRLGITPVVGLVHHGSGPKHTNLLDPAFAPGLAAFAGAVAKRYPWVEYWTPINEPLTTARFSCLYGIWYPHAKDDRSFVKALLNQCRATVLAMRAIRAINPGAKLIQTDDLGRTHGTWRVAETVDFYNARRWLGWDLLCGQVWPAHPLWRYLVENGAPLADLASLAANPCVPDLIGINYYVNSDRWLDHRSDAYPDRPAPGGSSSAPFVDIEAVRVGGAPDIGIGPLLEHAWQRYQIPIAVTEAHIDAPREDQLRWLLEIWQAAQASRKAGADIRAVTAWSLLGAFDWNCLLGECRGYYESGAYDVRTEPPRRTALADLITDLATGRAPRHPVIPGDGWWRRADRYLDIAGRSGDALKQCRGTGRRTAPPAKTILISGATGALGFAFAKVCAERNIAFELLNRNEMDIADPRSVASAFLHWKPWALINASGYVCPDEAKVDVQRCFRDNAVGPAVLAEQCARSDVALITFSSDQVFDGQSSRPWLERDPPSPLSYYGCSQATAEQSVLVNWPKAMVVRTSALFGPWDQRNVLVKALDSIEAGLPFQVPTDVRVSPTYLPDLVNVALNMLIDGESGLWHLVNAGDVSIFEFAHLACTLAGADSRLLIANRGVRPRTHYGVLGTERAASMPALEGAVAHFVACRTDAKRRFSEPASESAANVLSGSWGILSPVGS